MPSQVRIIQRRNAPEWDDKVAGWHAQFGYDSEQVYGGVGSQERADEIRRKIRTAAKRAGLSARVYWKPCDGRGRCAFGADCSHHVYFSFYDPAVAREFKAKQAQQQR